MRLTQSMGNYNQLNPQNSPNFGKIKWIKEEGSADLRGLEAPVLEALDKNEHIQKFCNDNHDTGITINDYYSYV